MCNECGNCAVFCPHAGKPYRDKFTIFSNGEDFKNSENPGFLKTGEGVFLLRLGDKTELKCRKGDAAVPPEYAAVIHAVTGKYPYLIV
jgi:putative selenate reductase